MYHLLYECTHLAFERPVCSTVDESWQTLPRVYRQVFESERQTRINEGAATATRIRDRFRQLRPLQRLTDRDNNFLGIRPEGFIKHDFSAPTRSVVENGSSGNVLSEHF